MLKRPLCLLLVLLMALAGCAQQPPLEMGKAADRKTAPADAPAGRALRAEPSYALDNEIVARPRDDILDEIALWLTADQALYVFDFSKSWSERNAAWIWVDLYQYGELSASSIVSAGGGNYGVNDVEPPENFTGSFMMIVEYIDGALRWYLSYAQSGQTRGFQYNEEAVDSLVSLSGGVSVALTYAVSYANQYPDRREKMQPTPITPGEEIVLNFGCYRRVDTEIDPAKQEKIEELRSCPGALSPSDESIRDLFSDYPLTYVVKCQFE